MFYKKLKTNVLIRIILLIVISLFLSFNIGVKAQPQIVEVSGYVKNSKNKKPLENAEISLGKTNIGTVTNTDGYFSLKLPIDNLNEALKVDLIGFEGTEVNLPKETAYLKGLNIYLSPTGKVLDEILVLGGTPKEIIEKALRNIPANYSGQNELFQGFYRETVQKGNRYISVAEAMVDLLKRPYSHRDVRGEKVSIFKGRKLISPKSSDTLSIKLMDGPFLPINFDAVKNGDHLFSIEEIDNFTFSMLPATIIDNRPHYAIEFNPIVTLLYPLHSGVFYIDAETFTISRVEFSLDMKDKNKVTQSILQKKPGGLKFKPLEVSGVVTYKTLEGKSYINYIATKIRFKCDWKKRLFSSTYTSMAEMVMVDRNDSAEAKNKFAESLGKRKIFSDMAQDYWEPDFWKDYNIIEPSESLENAVKKLKK